MKGKTGGIAAAVAAGMSLLSSSAFAGVADCGMLTNFASVTYQNTAGDPYSASYAVTAAVTIASPNLIVNKTASPTIQGAGGTVVFCIGFQNLSYCASAINVMIRDKVPDNMNFNLAAYVAWTTGPNDGAMTSEFSVNGTTWTAGTPAVVGQYYLRWTYFQLAPRESGVVCFRATVL